MIVFLNIISIEGVGGVGGVGGMTIMTGSRPRLLPVQEGRVVVHGQPVLLPADIGEAAQALVFPGWAVNRSYGFKSKAWRNI